MEAAARRKACPRIMTAAVQAERGGRREPRALHQAQPQPTSNPAGPAVPLSFRKSITMITFVNPPQVHTPTGYSHTAAVPAGTDLVFLSGQVGIRPDGSMPPTLAEQSEQMFDNIAAALHAHGLDASALVKLTLFVVAGHDIQTVRHARARLLGTHKPASTAVFVSQLVAPALFVECEAIAAKVRAEPTDTP